MSVRTTSVEGNPVGREVEADLGFFSPGTRDTLEEFWMGKEDGGGPSGPTPRWLRPGSFNGRSLVIVGRRSSLLWGLVTGKEEGWDPGSLLPGSFFATRMKTPLIPKQTLKRKG